jgi:thioredoxin 1
MDEGNVLMKNLLRWILLSSIILGMMALAQSKKTAKNRAPAAAKDTVTVLAKPLITFVELGSVTCIPCKAMQPIMKAVENKYDTQIRVVFYDVRTQEQAHYGQQYRIRLIPTQVFLDANGKELMRHEGFFPEKEIDVFLQSKGLKPKPNGKS